MVKIQIPFNKWSKQRLYEELKYATSRNKKYGNVGDWFEVIFNDKDEIRKYQLIEVNQTKLKSVRDFGWEDEGCRCPEEFVEVWKDIHPRKGWIDEQRVWFHRFRELD
jgi:hypothetical protein